MPNEFANRVIKGNQIVADDWTVLRLEEGQEPATVEVATGKVIVPLKVWQAQKETLAARPEIGVWLQSDERPEELKGELDKFSVVAVNFPKFTDGRGYSVARMLRERHAFTGELRAVGWVLRDNLLYMERCGFDAFELKPGKPLESGLEAFGELSRAYQANVHDKRPIYRRR